MTATTTTNPLELLASTAELPDGTSALNYVLAYSSGRAPSALTGSSPLDYAPLVVVVAALSARVNGVEIDKDALDHALSLVVNGHDDIAYTLVSCAYAVNAGYDNVLAFIGYGSVRSCPNCSAYYWSGMDDEQDDYCRNCHAYGTHRVIASA